MKLLLLATLLLSTLALADAYVKIDSIKGEAKETAAEVIDEEVNDVKTPVIDNEENAANDVKDSALHQPSGSATGQARQRADVKVEDVTVSKELDKSSTKAQDYNSSRSNRTTRDAASGLPTGKRQHRKLDTDDDGDSVDTLFAPAPNAVDNDCDDTTDTCSEK